MAGKTFLRQVTGRLTEIFGTQTSAGAGNAGDIVALDSSGKLDTTVFPTGIGAETASIVAGENLSAGDFIYVYDATGTPKVKKADATDPTKFAMGFVLGAFTSGNPATVYFTGINNQVSGMTDGVRQYLSITTPGGIQNAAPTGSGNIVQPLGVAISATELPSVLGEPITLA